MDEHEKRVVGTFLLLIGVILLGLALEFGDVEAVGKLVEEIFGVVKSGLP